MEFEGKEALTKLFVQWAGDSPAAMQALPKAGSDRQYYRLTVGPKSAIGVYSPDTRENQAFLSFSRHFGEAGVPVPEMYGENLAANVYLQQDLGNTSLLQLLNEQRQNGDFPKSILNLYKMSLESLAKMQEAGKRGLDYALCYPRSDFDRQSMQWDLNYFKYYFLKLAAIPFDEQLLENDFALLSDQLLQADKDYFMFRDFQARNIMIHEDRPWFIDYQGGRRGARQYDIASLLYQAKAGLPHEIRMELLDHYMDVVDLSGEGRKSFKQMFFRYLLIRTLQVLGAYGFRGFFERRPHFLESIPPALDDLHWLVTQVEGLNCPPYLQSILVKMRASERLREFGRTWEKPASLTVRVRSFSYKQALPEDPSGNGGGFYFDCRAIHNPGRFEAYKKQTGRDQPVIDFLEKMEETERFFTHSAGIVEASVRRYLDRGFSDLMVGFGCTGGQHRSVYMADRMARHLQRKYGVTIDLHHIVQEAKNWIN